MTPATRTVCLGLLAALMPCLASCAAIIEFAWWLDGLDDRSPVEKHIASIDHVEETEYEFDVSLPAMPAWRIRIEGPSAQRELSEVRWTVSVETPDDYLVDRATPSPARAFANRTFVVYDGPMAEYYPASGQILLCGNSFSLRQSGDGARPYQFVIRLKFDRTLQLQNELSLDAAW